MYRRNKNYTQTFNYVIFIKLRRKKSYIMRKIHVNKNIYKFNTFLKNITSCIMSVGKKNYVNF